MGGGGKGCDRKRRGKGETLHKTNGESGLHGLNNDIRDE